MNYLRRIVIVKLQKQERERDLRLKEISRKVIDPIALQKESRTFPYRPKISIIIPTYNSRPDLLAKVIDSIRDQIYDNWEICIADDHSTHQATLDSLRQYESDPGIRVCFLSVNGGISAATNAAIGLATGEYTALMDHDDEIPPEALFEIVKSLNSEGEADILYTDECKVDENGNLSDYFFKPDWDPELLLNFMYTGHFTIYRKDFLREYDLFFRSEYDFSQDYDLMLRSSEKTSRIRHIPQVLYHWRMTEGSAAQGDKPFARKTNLAALEDAMKRRGIAADVVGLPTANRVKIKMPRKPGVSVIIPTDSYTNLYTAIRNFRDSTDYPDHEIIVVTNSGLIEKALGDEVMDKVRFVPYDKPYNFSDKCNCGAQAARGEILIFFNDDVRPLQSDWIENTIEYLFIPGVGGVSPKLIYEDDTIQYAGMAAGVRNLIGTTLHGYPRNTTAYSNYAQSVRDVSILSGACLAISKTLFLEIGGFDALNTPSAHSDTDLSFRILERGLRCVYTPYATLRHIGHLSLEEHEKKEARSKKDKADIYILKRWVRYLSHDAYFTKPMREYLYHDSPEPFQLYPSKEFTPQDGKRDILVISHDLSRSGAPISLLEACCILRANGYFVFVCAPEDGPLREDFQKAGFSVATDALLFKQDNSFLRFARNFDLLFCNTIVTWPVVRQMQNVCETVWWLQEGKGIEKFVTDPDCEETLRNADNVIGLSDYSLSFIRKYNPRAVKLFNSCFDLFNRVIVPNANETASRGRMVFSLIGSLEERKGQDILLNALSYIDASLLQHIEIRLIGRFHNPYFVNDLKKKAESKDYIHFKGELSREETLRQMAESDVILSASRDEAFSVVLVEAFSMGKPCILSAYTGMAEFVSEGENGYVFQNNDPKRLAEKMTRAIQDNLSGKLKEIGLAARSTYLRELNMDRFGERLLLLLNKNMVNSSKFIPLTHE